MHQQARIRVLDYAVGEYPEVLTLNPRFRPDVPKVKLCLDVQWNPRDPARALSQLEAKLLEVCPDLRKHQCRGDSNYCISHTRNTRALARRTVHRRLDASLALAHLLEHVLVDAIAFVTNAPAVSGVTGALKDSRRHFDVFVECPDPSVAPLVVDFSLTWIVALAHGRSPEGGGRATLELARHLYRRRSGAVDLAVAARVLARPPHEIAEGVGWLEQRNFAQRVAYTMNFSGTPPYGLKLAEV